MYKDRVTAWGAAWELVWMAALTALAPGTAATFFPLPGKAGSIQFSADQTVKCHQTTFCKPGGEAAVHVGSRGAACAHWGVVGGSGGVGLTPWARSLSLIAQDRTHARLAKGGVSCWEPGTFSLQCWGCPGS